MCRKVVVVVCLFGFCNGTVDEEAIYHVYTNYANPVSVSPFSVFVLVRPFSAFVSVGPFSVSVSVGPFSVSS